MGARGGTGASARAGIGRKATVALLGGSLAILPALVVSDSTARWWGLAEQDRAASSPLEGGRPNELGPVSVDGSLPDSVTPEELSLREEPTEGSLGIPQSALAAYRRAATQVGAEHPGCHIDWALLASIGRIESNHASGGYVDSAGDTLEAILGPVLDGKGNVAAIADTDGGRYDGDTTWDRAVGPMQFIPSTWTHYAADGNGDGVSDPNNIHDAAVAAGRYLCSGGVDLSDSQQLRAAVYRYNNSWAYVDTVIRWAKAYRGGVTTLPDGDLPSAVPETLLAHGAGQSHDSSFGAHPPSGGAEPTQPPASTEPAPETPETPDKPEVPDESEDSSPTPEPTEPPATDPTDPNPTDPEDPTEPTEPTEPEDPTDPTDPSDPTDPEDPTEPTDPTDPTEPEDPEEPTEPEPTDPEEPTDPTEPSDPTDPPTTEPDPGECDPDEDEPSDGDEEPGSNPTTTAPTSPADDPAHAGSTAPATSSTPGDAPTDPDEPTDPPCEDDEPGEGEDGTSAPEQVSATKESDADGD